MNGDGASAIYHDKATWTGNSAAGHITNSIPADLVDCCVLPITLPLYYIMDLSQFLGTYSLKCVHHCT